jgi:hypothetical protein
MVSETKNKLSKLFISTFIEWIARFSIEWFWFIFWQYERPTNWQYYNLRLYSESLPVHLGIHIQHINLYVLIRSKSKLPLWHYVHKR